MREIAVIADELKTLAADIKDKTVKQKAAEDTYVKASKELETAQQKISDLKIELQEVIGVLVPSTMQGRVRAA